MIILKGFTLVTQFSFQILIFQDIQEIFHIDGTLSDGLSLICLQLEVKLRMIEFNIGSTVETQPMTFNVEFPGLKQAPE